AYCWGYNGWGQLGNGTTEDGQRPVAVAGGLHFTALTAGYMHNCGVTASGAAYCWGYNGYHSGFGPLGNGSVTPSSVPVAVAGGPTFTAISAGGFDAGYACAVATSGAAYCWGEGGYGELGIGASDLSLVPVSVSGGLTFSAVDAGWRYHTCGLTTSGAAYCWGL